jgi:hypothetical protein
MSTTLPDQDSTYHESSPECPNCSSPLRMEGEESMHYYSCLSCNLVFLA